MAIFKVVCFWEQTGTFNVEADSLEEAVELVSAAGEGFEDVPSESETVEGSFEADLDASEEANEEDDSEDSDDDSDEEDEADENDSEDEEEEEVDALADITAKLLAARQAKKIVAPVAPVLSADVKEGTKTMTFSECRRLGIAY
jgi:hypothetical protein